MAQPSELPHYQTLSRNQWRIPGQTVLFMFVMMKFRHIHLCSLHVALKPPFQFHAQFFARPINQTAQPKAVGKCAV
jgi:hypothetical protein